ncbi:VWA domain-containing protein [Methylobacterium planeticum]|uniref:VWA domain-containing protein n=1 Tax=Methylobacterium planeticum TaxID=2615211 RepID=A0A6N6MNS1_9HYPH|nr:VWA domain-containing protein [Methylobacterium planeticum]
MEALSALHVERPWWLLLLLPALLLWFLEERVSETDERWRGVIDPALLRHLLVGREPSSRAGPNALLILAWILATIAVAGPAWELEPSPFADAEPPVMIVLKVTPSMTTADLSPSRLDRARQKLADLVSLREGAATGLIAYSGASHLVLPPTPDGAVVLDLAKALSPEIMPKDGDDLAGAVTLADVILVGRRRGGSILVMADTVTGEQVSRLAGAKLTHPATILALLPPDQDPGRLEDAERALHADLVATTVGQADVDAIAGRLDRAGRIEDVAGEGRHWKDAGYWLTPVLALLTLLWFRRGWVLA